MKKAILLFLTILIEALSFTRASWSYIENDRDDRTYFGEETDITQIIYLDEEVREYITIAHMSYTGTTEPTVNFLSTVGNSVLGLVFQQNSTFDNRWALVVTMKQDYEASIWGDGSRRYNFDVTADGFTVQTYLFINNIDDNPPVLQPASNRTCAIEENYEGITNCTYTISDLDGWIQYTKYSIRGSYNEENLFEFRLEDPDSILNNTYEATLVLYTINELDFETRSIYFFDLIATDSGNNNGTLKIYVEVIDMPDMPPTWTTIFASLQFDEKTNQNYTVNAIDGDIGVNYEINYLLTTQLEWDEFFYIDNKTGVITINPIDRDALDNSIYYFTILAYEVPDPIWNISQTITVIVNDINDNYPVITLSPSSVTIYENMITTLPINITINDIDTGNNAVYTVKLTDNSGMGYSEAFQIVPNQGYKKWTFSISVTNSSLLDYEIEDWQEISFDVYSLETLNNSHYDTFTVNVSLMNWNDEYPIFESSEYEITINETIGINETIATVYATDRDIGDTVTHSLLGTAINRVLRIDPETGEISTTTQRSFDYETSDEVIVQVMAQDSLNNTVHSVIAQLTIHVLDINDKTPTISIPPTIISTEENRDDGATITEAITATDPDSTANLEFRINWTSPTTYATKYGQRVEAENYVNSIRVQTVNISQDSTGYAKAVLTVNEIVKDNTPDYELFDTLYLTLTVEDLNQQINDGTATVVVSIIIIDLNDNAPIFTNSSITASNSVIENALAGTIIGTITATDADGIQYNVVSYSLRTAGEGTPEGWVIIDSNTGQLTVNVSDTIDADLPIYYLNYTVSATDGEWITEATISIYVVDTNDNVPVIQSNLTSPFEIYEKSPDDEEVTVVEVTDADRDSPYNSVSFTLSTDDEEVFFRFMFHTTSGRFYVNKRLNYELDRDFGQQNFTVSFTVADNYLGTGPITYTVRSSLLVTLLDINDQYPTISNTSITTTENMVQGNTIGNLVAYDYDQKGTDNTRIDFKILAITNANDANADIPEDLFILKTDDNFETQVATVFTNYNLRGYYGTYNVLIQTNDFGTLPTQLFLNQTISFVVERYNFRAPTITYPSRNSTIYLSRDQTIGNLLYLYNGETLESFTATDNQGEKWNLRLSIQNEENSRGERTSFFSLQTLRQNSARLVMSSYPDFTNTYKLTVLADCECSGDEPFTTSVDVNIRFHDLTAEPMFPINTQNLSYYENETGLNTTHKILEAFWNSAAEEWDEFPIYYVIESDTTGGCFELDSNSRNLTLRYMLDREEIDSHTLTIQASQNPRGSVFPSASARLTVHIEVLDVNDNPPHFDLSEYFGGVTTSTTIGSVVLTLHATDLDIDDELHYFIDERSMMVSDSSLSDIINPFVLNNSTGTLTLNFQVLASMAGFFTFTAVVIDLANHTDVAIVKIYIVSDVNRVTFTFENPLSSVTARYNEITTILQDSLGYVANIESIQASTDGTGNTVGDRTNIICHFINEGVNEVIEASVIQAAASNLVTFGALRTRFLNETSLYLISLSDDNSNSGDNTDAILKAWLIGLTTVLFAMCVGLVVAFILRTRSLTNRLEKLTEKKFGSHESGLNRLPVAVPGTNKNAIEGTNPVYNEDKRMPDLDTYSISSGDSDLIGIEDNADFDPKPELRESNNRNIQIRERF